MRSDPFGFLKNLESKKPKLARFLAMQFLNRFSPFNNNLKAKLLAWTDGECRIFVKKRRTLQNHVGNIHAGAIFTLGETCAGLVIIRNFPFQQFRPLMSDVKVNYSKQARADITGVSLLDPETVRVAQAQVASGEIPTIEMRTNIWSDVKGSQEIIAVVTTVWQVKPWKDVRG